LTSSPDPQGDGVRPVSGTLGAGPNLPAQQTSAVTNAMILMIAAMMLAPLMDALSKLLSTRHEVGPVTITWVRFVGQAVLLFFVIGWRIGFAQVNGRHNVINLLRGMLVGAAVSIFFIALKYLPLADAIAIFFVEPLIVLLLSAMFLGERVGWRRVLAAVVGFGGALLIIQPTYADFGPVALLPLATATLFSVYLILSRKFGAADHPYTMQFWSGIGGVLTCSVFMLIGTVAGVDDMQFQLPLSNTVVLYLAAMILIATVAHLLIVIAFTRAEASILAPFQYLEIVTMTIAGYLIFGDFPTPLKWVGIAIIIGSGLYIFLRERSAYRTDAAG
jgi:drug/metabolite transporter (DMT)-like permease